MIVGDCHFVFWTADGWLGWALLVAVAIGLLRTMNEGKTKSDFG